MHVNLRYFPLSIPQKYYASEFYYWGNLADGTYTCRAGIDDRGKRYNAACLDSDAITFVDGKTVEYKNNTISTCEQLPKEYCVRPVEIVDVLDIYTFSEMCKYVEGDFCTKVAVNQNIVRPKNADMRSDPSIKLWYIGDPSYTIGYDWFCNESSDQLDPINDYHNVWCDFRNGFDQPNIYDDGNLIFCHYPGWYYRNKTKDKIEDKIEDHNDDLPTKAPLGTTTDSYTGSTTVHFNYPTDSYGDRFNYAIMGECTYTRCDQLPRRFCYTGVDLYSLDKDEPILLDTCVYDGLQGCISKDAEVIKFHKPTNNLQAVANWWYVGSTSYDTTTVYECDSDQDIGTTDQSYINISCDPDFTGKVTKKDAIRCKDNDNFKGMTKYTHTACTPQLCSSLPGHMCRQPIDLYTDDGTTVKMVDTCVSDGAEGCKSRALRQPTIESTETVDKQQNDDSTVTALSS